MAEPVYRSSTWQREVPTLKFTPRMVAGRVSKSAKHAGLDKRGVHILRHSFCSHLAMSGAVPVAVQGAAGHRDLKTTQRYLHLSPGVVESAIRLLDNRQQPDPNGNMLASAGAPNAK